MNTPFSACRQRGATLVVGLIMLLLITLMVSSAFTLSGTNLKAVGNMQRRDEAIAAANIAIEQKISGAFDVAPVGEKINVDINNDNVMDYEVEIAKPECVRASQVNAASGEENGENSELPKSWKWNTVWSLDATVNDAASGASSHVRSGVRVLLTEAEKNVTCP